jgi:hypothetical protein
MTTYRKCLIRKKPLKNNGPQGADVEYGGEGVTEFSFRHSPKQLRIQ